MCKEMDLCQVNYKKGALFQKNSTNKNTENVSQNKRQFRYIPLKRRLLSSFKVMNIDGKRGIIVLILQGLLSWST